MAAVRFTAQAEEAEMRAMVLRRVLAHGESLAVPLTAADADLTRESPGSEPEE